MSYITINARGTNIQAPIAILDKSPLLEQWHIAHKNDKTNDNTFYVNVHPDVIHKLLDSLFPVDIHEYFMINTKNGCKIETKCNYGEYLSDVDMRFTIITPIYTNMYRVTLYSGSIKIINNKNKNNNPELTYTSNMDEYMSTGINKMIPNNDYYELFREKEMIQHYGKLFEEKLSLEKIISLYGLGKKGRYSDKKCMKYKGDNNIKKLLLYIIYLIICDYKLEICLNSMLQIDEIKNIKSCVYRLIYLK